MIDATCNAGYLLLGDFKTLSMSQRFVEVARKASERCRPHDEGKSEISDFLSVGHLGPVLQGFGCDLRLQKVKKIRPYGHRDSAKVRFNLLFDMRIHGHIYLARFYEAGVVDHLVVINSRQWPGLIYDSCDQYTLILSSSPLFQCGAPDANKMKITQLYEVIRNRGSGEKTKHLKQQLLTMPRGVKRQRSNES